MQYYNACFIAEGIFGCFKDKVLSQIDYELMPLKLSCNTEQQLQPKGDCVFIGPSWRESDIVCLPSNQKACPMPILHQVSALTVINTIIHVLNSYYCNEYCSAQILINFEYIQGDWVYAVRMGAYTSSISYNSGAVAAKAVSIQQDPLIYVVEPRNYDCI